MSIPNHEQQSHVVIFPLPLQGPVNCMLNLSELILSLTQAQVSITFVNTEYIQRRLDLHSGAGARMARFGPRFKFEAVVDGLGPDENPRGARELPDLTISLGAQAQAHGSRLREVLASDSSPSPVTCIIADGFYGFMVDVAKEIGVPLVYFDTVSPCGLWTYLCVPMMLQARQLPFQGDDLDEQITSVPGMEDYLRRRDLPSFCRAYNPENKVIQLIIKEAQNFPKAQGHILNTFDHLEGNLLQHYRALLPNLYNIGPLHLHLKTRVHQKTSPTSSSSNSLWQEDRSCLAWLDTQPSKSILFVSIGSIAVMSKYQLNEFWHGLVNSKTRFLWVRRPGSIIDDGDCNKLDNDLDVPMEVFEGGSGPIYVDGSNRIVSVAKNHGCATEGLKEQGFLASWVPQEEVLAHNAVGGFLTHSGWNSTLESIVEGVPMICWPSFVDQQVNSRVVDHVWSVGLDMKDTCDRVVIKKMVQDLMGAQINEFTKKTNEFAELAAQAVNENGSSYHDLNRLIEDIQHMRLSVASDANI